MKLQKGSENKDEKIDETRITISINAEERREKEGKEQDR